MPPPRLHADEVHIDASLARTLLSEQHPAFSSLPLRRVEPGGTDNVVFRLGNDLALRLPLRPSAVSGVQKEIRWLPFLAPHLSLDVPDIVAVGTPTDGYPFPWAVMRWLPGDDAWAEPIGDGVEAAQTLGRFVTELREVSTAGAPAPGTEGFVRGLPLVEWDADVRSSLAECTDLLDVGRAGRMWQDALSAAPYDGPPVWLHADLIPGNLLVRHGRVTGVLDFGAMCIGDPAYDVTPAWHVLDHAGRAVFRRLLGADDATWRRARGIVVALAVFAIPYYHRTNPVMMRTARRGLAAAFSDEI